MPEFKQEWQFFRNEVKVAIFLIIACASLLVIGILVAVFTSLSFINSMRIFLGSFFVLFLPGFFISYLFFPRTRAFSEDSTESARIDWLERIALSIALSIAIVPLIIFYLNLIGMKITTINSLIVIFVIIILSLLGIYIRNKKKL